jgi:hypothetical protein
VTCKQQIIFQGTKSHNSGTTKVKIINKHTDPYTSLLIYFFFFSLLSAVFSFVFIYVLLADYHVNNVSYFPLMSIKKVVLYFCVLREDYYVIIWLIVRICVFIKD